MADPFALEMTGLSDPASHHYAVTPSDGSDLSPRPRAVYVGGAGDVSMTDAGGAAVTWAGVPAGTTIPFRAVRIRSTGTTATNIVAIY